MAECRVEPERYLIIPDESWESAALLRAQSTATGTPREEAGRAPGRATVSASSPPVGDIRATLSGLPEAHVEGDIRISKAGVVEDGRFGFVREGDDTTTDLQFRQSPHVCGRTVALLDRQTTRMHVRPKLLPLASGDLLCAYYEADWLGIEGADAVAIRVITEQTYLFRFDGSAGSWGDKITGPSFFNTDYTSALDFVQFPDTEEIVMFTARSNGVMNLNLFVHWSADDGDTWQERRKLHFTGIAPDISLGVDTDFIQSMASELLPSGRIVLLVQTLTNIWSLTSDDRGSSWAVTFVRASRPSYGYDMGGTLTRTGVALFVETEGFQFHWLATENGLDWSEFEVRYTGTARNVALCTTPDGYVHFFGTLHDWVNASAFTSGFADWMFGRRLRVRDPRPGDALTEWFPRLQAAVPDTIRGWAFHCEHVSLSPPSGSMFEPFSTPIQINGPYGIDAVSYRGQIVIVSPNITNLYTPSAGKNSISNSALMIYRTNHWQPLREDLPDIRSWLGSDDGIPHWPAGGHAYNMTWDCYQAPGVLGWTTVGGGAQFLVAGGAEDGYLRVLNARYYQETAPNIVAPDSSLEAVVRAVLLPIAGGSTSTSRIAIHGRFSSGGSGGDWQVRFEVLGSDIKISAHDSIAGQIGSTPVFPVTQWLEVLIASKSEGGGKYKLKVYARTHDRANDPDWDSPYEEVVDVGGLTTVVGTDLFQWGHITTSTGDESYWKTVQISRRDIDTGVDLVQKGITYQDVDSVADLSNAGYAEAPIDSGIDNLMRTPQMVSTPAQYLSRRTSAAWRGEALTSGQMDFASHYVHAGGLVTSLPSLQDWRSENTNIEAELVFDVDPDGEGLRVRPDAIAVFGRNFPRLTLQMHSSDSWGAPTVQIDLSHNGGDPGPVDRYTHLWAGDDGVADDYYINGKRLTVFPSSGSGPWRPHQFRSMETGQRYYLTLQVSAVDHVYRIVDNTEDTLILHTAPSVADVGVVGPSGSTWPNPFAIFGDRFSARLTELYPATFTGGGDVYANSNVEGYRYVRLLCKKAYHHDADEAQFRLGLAMLGGLFDLGNPATQWGWSSSLGSGSTLRSTSRGTKTVSRKAPPLRTVDFSYGFLRPPQEASANLWSPLSAIAQRKSWAHWLDMVRRLEIDRTPVALVWRGERMESSPGASATPVTADVHDLMLGRVTQAGTIEHVSWEHRSINLPSGAADVLRPAVEIKSIQIQEEL